MYFTEIHLYLHLILAVKGRGSFIASEVKHELEDYLTEMITVNGHKIHAISCMPDHTHLLISWNPDFSIDNLTEEVKQLARHFILYRKWNKSFDWQEDYGAFSCSLSEVETISEYINNQVEYHKTKRFEEEFKGLLQKHEIEYCEDDLLEFYD